MAKTASEIISSIESYIKNKRPTLDTSTGQLVRDIVAEAVAAEISKIYDEIDDVKLLSSVGNYADISESDFDDVAKNYGLVRVGAGKATGEVTFGTYTLPGTSIRIGNADGSGGVTIQSRNDETGIVVSFVTTETVYLTPTTVFNSSTGLYEVDASIEATIAGTSSNVGVGSITQIVTSVTGVDTVTNKVAISNGTEKETNTSLYERILTKIEGLVIGSRSGYKALVDADANVLDSLVVIPDDADAVRGNFNGGVDIYILGETRSTVDQTETSDGVTGTILLNYQPAVSISSIVGITNGTVYSSVTDYSLFSDSGNFAGSVNGQDSLVWVTSSIPPLGIDYKITYIRNNLIKTLQDTLDEDDNNVVNSDVLVKEGVLVNTDIQLTVTLNAGYSSTTVKAQVETAIDTFVNALGLGDDLQQSDLVTYIQNNVPGVDSITLPFTRLARLGNTGASDLVAKDYEYFRSTSTSVVVTIA